MAEGHFKAAAALEEGMGTPAFVAHTRYWHAWMLPGGVPPATPDERGRCCARCGLSRSTLTSPGSSASPPR